MQEKHSPILILVRVYLKPKFGMKGCYSSVTSMVLLLRRGDGQAFRLTSNACGLRAPVRCKGTWYAADGNWDVGGISRACTGDVRTKVPLGEWCRRPPASETERPAIF